MSLQEPFSFSKPAAGIVDCMRARRELRTDSTCSISPVKQVGSHVTAFAPGDKVILSFASCHTCRACLSGHAPYCKYLQELNFSSKRLAPTPTSPTSTASSPPTTSTAPCTDSTGAHLNNFFFGQSSLARLVLAHENGAIKLDPSVSKDELIKFASLGCGIQTGAGAVLNIIKPGPSSTIAIIGAGAVGLAASFMASLYSPHRLILIDNSATKLANLPEKHGATHLIDSSNLKEGELVEKLMELTDGEGVEYVIDAVGSPQVLRDGHRAMAKGGMIVTLGGIVKDCGIIINEHLVKGGTWRGTHQGDSVPRMVSLASFFLLADATNTISPSSFQK